jgi:hypothetical protein
MIVRVRNDGDPRQVQAASAVMMVRPASFAHNEQTAQTNRFQHASIPVADLAHQAQAQFDAAVSSLRGAGVKVCVIDDTPVPRKPDALFPNNWVSFHRDGTVILYPMLAPNRRCERRPEIIDVVQRQLGFQCRDLLDLSAHEHGQRYLEGTGSLVLDHVQRIAYAARSARTDETLVREWAHAMRYEPELFDAAGSDGTSIYHTNVLLSIGTRWAVVCAASIADGDRERVLRRLRRDREVIEITAAEMDQFGANILELLSVDGSSSQHTLVLSERALVAFERMPGDGWRRLRSSVDRMLPIAVPVIEAVGGGGIRCMLAEVPAGTA